VNKKSSLKNTLFHILFVLLTCRSIQSTRGLGQSASSNRLTDSTGALPCCTAVKRVFPVCAANLWNDLSQLGHLIIDALPLSVFRPLRHSSFVVDIRTYTYLTFYWPGPRNNAYYLSHDKLL